MRPLKIMYKLQVYLASLQFAVRKTETSAYRGIRLKISTACVTTIHKIFTPWTQPSTNYNL